MRDSIAEEQHYTTDMHKHKINKNIINSMNKYTYTHRKREKIII